MGDSAGEVAGDFGTGTEPIFPQCIRQSFAERLIVEADSSQDHVAHREQHFAGAATLRPLRLRLIVFLTP